MKILLLLAAVAPMMLQQQVFSFGDDEPGKAPKGFEFTKTGKGEEPLWFVEKDDGGERCLEQKNKGDGEKDRFPLAIIKDFTGTHVRVSAKIKTISGKVDQSGGLVWRYKDKDNYYVVRLNSLEDNIRLYAVKDGIRKTIDKKEGLKIALATWHTLQVDHQGVSIKVLFNGETVITKDDKTFADAGKAGVWTKADAVTRFDDVSVEELKK